MTRDKVTISEVAKRAGVSIGTASHVLSGRVKVREDTRRRVAEAVEALGYIPNIHARALRQTESKIVGLCFPHRSSAFMSDLSEMLEQIGTDAGYSVMHVFSRQETETELRRIKELLRVQIDGLILHPSATPQETLDFLCSMGKPVVLIDSSNEDARFDRVVLDNQVTMEAAVQRLLAIGHRRVLYVCRRSDIALVKARVRGLANVKSVRPEFQYETIVYRGDNAYLASEIGRALGGKQPPTAIIAGNSEQAALTIAALRAAGADYPGKVSLLAFDEPDWSTIVSPSLSVIRQPTSQIASAAWEMLLDRIADPEAPPRKILASATIELRDSVQPISDASAEPALS